MTRWFDIATEAITNFLIDSRPWKKIAARIWIGALVAIAGAALLYGLWDALIRPYTLHQILTAVGFFVGTAFGIFLTLWSMFHFAAEVDS